MKRPRADDDHAKKTPVAPKTPRLSPQTVTEQPELFCLEPGKAFAILTQQIQERETKKARRGPSPLGPLGPSDS